MIVNTLTIVDVLCERIVQGSSISTDGEAQNYTEMESQTEPKPGTINRAIFMELQMRSVKVFTQTIMSLTT